MPIAHLPETRRALLQALKTDGPSTIAQLATKLELSAEGVRQQLAQLQREHFIETAVHREEQGKAGRPPTLFRLSAEGEHLFPKAYAELNVILLDAAHEALGPDAVGQVLEKVAERWAAQWAQRVAGLPLPSRANVLKSVYQEGDAFMEVSSGNDGTLTLVEKNCPYLKTALERPAVCGVTVNVLSRLLGAKVTRGLRFQDGAGCCSFVVDPRSPVAPDAPYVPEA